MLVRHKVEDFARWKAVFDSHFGEQERAGMELKHIWQKDDDPNDVFFLIKIRSRKEVEDFMNQPQQPEIKEQAGVVGQPEVYFLN
jgi:hypothetical protein